MILKMVDGSFLRVVEKKATKGKLRLVVKPQKEYCEGCEIATTFKTIEVIDLLSSRRLRTAKVEDGTVFLEQGNLSNSEISQKVSLCNRVVFSRPLEIFTIKGRAAFDEKSSEAFLELIADGFETRSEIYDAGFKDGTQYFEVTS